MDLNFQDIFMRFSSDGKEIEIRGTQGKRSKAIISNRMKNLLKNGHHGVITQLFSLDVQTYISSAPLDLQIVINNHSKVFGEMPKGLPAPTQDHDHAIKKGQFHQIFPKNMEPSTLFKILSFALATYKIVCP